MALAAKIVSGLKADFASQVVRNLSSGLLVVVLARLLEPNEYGLLYLAISVFAIVTVIGRLGLGKSAARYLTEYEERDAGQIPHIVETVALALAVTLGTVTVALIVAREPLAALLGEPGLEELLLVGALYVAGHGLVNSGRNLCQGFKEIEWAAYITLVEAVVRPIVAIGLVLAGLGAVGALVGYVVSSLLGAALFAAVIYRLYSRAERGELETGLRRRIAEYALPITLTENGSTIIKRVDVVLIGAFLTPLAVSYYVVAKQLLTFVKSPANSLGFAISPRYSEQLQRGNLETASRLYGEALTATLVFYVPAAAGLAIVAEPTLALVFGPEYAGGAIVLQLLTIYLVAQAVSYVTSGGLDYLGRAKHRAYAKGAAAVANLLLNLALIPTIGIAGAAISTAGTYAAYVTVNVYLIHLELDLDWRAIGRRCAKVGAVTAVMSLVVLPLSPMVDGVVSLAAVVALGTAVWLGATVSIGLLERQQLRSAAPF
ncbi:polysaccharide biosynthesis protein [Natronococcus amylolyticus DSM 10524]|uniref:Polysaccharide biosynthesis protein n=1 Tax=Natronococcus amylolyticus DSM 10524 TaxID=1227497 RepID=L9WYM3_9EURY|nr:flippase [Natronococcus amylolyticus]ELY54564.1 polysaccharide biosynthesis protein [Natronococcus amylolyticus DSM 10524]